MMRIAGHFFRLISQCFNAKNNLTVQGYFVESLKSVELDLCWKYR